MSRKRPKRPQVYRVCAVCGKRHGPTYGFHGVLLRNGIKGDKAVPACVAKLRGFNTLAGFAPPLLKLSNNK